MKKQSLSSCTQLGMKPTTHTITQSLKQFLHNLLFGMALAVVIALAPNAILGTLLKPYSTHPNVVIFLDALAIMQGLVSFITGVLVALAFNFNPMKSTIIGATAFISSGVLKHTDEGVMLVGIGDLLNVLIFTSLAVLVTQWLGDKLGSLTIIVQPIIVGVCIGFLGRLTLPYVSRVTFSIGEMISYFMQLQPFLMCVLISISFAILIISPISTVAISLIIGLTGLASGSANLGVTSTAAVLIIGSFYAKNKLGVSLAILFGAMKMMIPNLFRSPIMYMAIIANGTVGGIIAYIFHITGDAKSAGFGLAGLVGPVEAYNNALNEGVNMPFVQILMAYSLPFFTALLFHLFLLKTVKRYENKIYYFNEK